jgi:hypothetical protein
LGVSLQKRTKGFDSNTIEVMNEERQEYGRLRIEGRLMMAAKLNMK